MSSSLPSSDLARLLPPPRATKESAGESRPRPEDCLFTSGARPGITDSLHGVNWED